MKVKVSAFTMRSGWYIYLQRHCFQPHTRRHFCLTQLLFFVFRSRTNNAKYTRRFPGLRSFLKDGEAAKYRDVAVHYDLRVKHAVLHVYDDDDRREVDTIPLPPLRTKERLHAVMRRYFERKSESEIQRDRDRQTRHRQQKAYRKFQRAEYVRQQQVHVQQFRQEVMREEPVTWVSSSKDWLCHNYDQINKGAITKQDLLRSAREFLMEQHSE